MSLPLIKGFLAAAVAVAGTAGAVAVTHNSDSVGAGVSVTGPVCVTRTAQPGATVTAMASVVNGSGSTVKIDVSTDPVVGQPVGPPYPDGGHPIYKQLDHPAGKTWAQVGGPYEVPPRTTIKVPIIVHVAAHAPKGPYGTMLYAHSYGTPGSSGDQMAFAGGDGVYFAMSVGVRPPPHCSGWTDWPWPSGWTPPLPVCGHNQVPLRGQQAMCRVLPLPPPAASARACHWPIGEWDRYITQLERAGRRYAGSATAYLKDAHCIVDGRFLNLAWYYRQSGMYRYGAHQTGPLSGARPVSNPDNWRTAGSS